MKTRVDLHAGKIRRRTRPIVRGDSMAVSRGLSFS